MSAESDDIATWSDQAQCLGTDPEAFHTDRRPPAIVRKICASCPVRPLCRDYSIDNGMSGVWGGLTKAERERYAEDHGMVFGAPPTFDQLVLG